VTAHLGARVPGWPGSQAGLRYCHERRLGGRCRKEEKVGRRSDRGMDLRTRKARNDSKPVLAPSGPCQGTRRQGKQAAVSTVIGDRLRDLKKVVEALQSPRGNRQRIVSGRRYTLSTMFLCCCGKKRLIWTRFGKSLSVRLLARFVFVTQPCYSTCPLAFPLGTF